MGHRRIDIIIKTSPQSSLLATKQARQVVVIVYAMMLMDYVTLGNEISATRCIKGIPQDALLTHAVYRREGLFKLVFEHESFDEVRVGSPIPIFELEFGEI